MSYVRRVLIRGCFEGLAGVLVWFASMLLAQWLLGRLESPEDSPWALVILLLPLAGLAVLIWVTVRDLRRRDEMEQRCFGLAAMTTLFALLAFAVVHELYGPLVAWPDINPIGWVLGAWVFWWLCFHFIRRLLL